MKETIIVIIANMFSRNYLISCPSAFSEFISS